jgi:hypothetical protein
MVLDTAPVTVVSTIEVLKVVHMRPKRFLFKRVGSIPFAPLESTAAALESVLLVRVALLM